ncbi:MAG: hypothetical protein JWQ90_4246 [Hydrocarboniphaga sp.]|uniref:hypothetical protein n=1 Tax=Hydrocarboniphaga sp. TaxID=2033016 RepID=UPI0026324E26|nr:hypothetical protein [Hydrocarboniphaga sp.]MDB5971796.1 hypothetical protein [Hydrocarboniphaga sp.]
MIAIERLISAARKRLGPEGKHQWTRSALLCPLLLAGLPGNSSAAGLVQAVTGNFCSAAAADMRTACGFDTADNFWVKSAICANLADADERAACEEEKRQDFADDHALCAAQYAGRADVCKDLGEARYDPVVDPANFVDPAAIGTSVAANPFLILTPGYTRIYSSPTELITVTVTKKTVKIDGVICTVVHDISKSGNYVNEDTDDYFAQDLQGNVWYFGELSTAYDKGELPSTDGSFKAGIDGAKPGIVMFAAAQLGQEYREEFALGEAEDIAKVESLTATETVPAASCAGNCLKTLNFTPLEPDATENKFYVPGIGEIVSFDSADPSQREELVEYHY